MANTEHPMALRYPAELMAPATADLRPLALLSPEQHQRLVTDLQELTRIEYEFMAAQQVISQIDLYAATIALQTIQAAERIKLLYGGSEDLEAYDQARQEQYLETMQALVGQAHAQILARLQQRSP